MSSSASPRLWQRLVHTGRTWRTDPNSMRMEAAAVALVVFFVARNRRKDIQCARDALGPYGARFDWNDWSLRNRFRICASLDGGGARTATFSLPVARMKGMRDSEDEEELVHGSLTVHAHEELVPIDARTFYLNGQEKAGCRVVALKKSLQDAWSPSTWYSTPRQISEFIFGEGPRPAQFLVAQWRVTKCAFVNEQVGVEYDFVPRTARSGKSSEASHGGLQLVAQREREEDRGTRLLSEVSPMTNTTADTLSKGPSEQQRRRRLPFVWNGMFALIFGASIARVSLSWWRRRAGFATIMAQAQREILTTSGSKGSVAGGRSQKMKMLDTTTSGGAINSYKNKATTPLVPAVMKGRKVQTNSTEDSDNIAKAAKNAKLAKSRLGKSLPLDLGGLFQKGGVQQERSKNCGHFATRPEQELEGVRDDHRRVGVFSTASASSSAYTYSQLSAPKLVETSTITEDKISGVVQFSAKSMSASRPGRILDTLWRFPWQRSLGLKKVFYETTATRSPTTGAWVLLEGRFLATA
ncbi:unnamed protein product [Amoebophrya sp. A25]|nr:unnamed protein product [Amoebophrya sp. A25]|eukprot:GSA25T00020366001.1